MNALALRLRSLGGLLAASLILLPMISVDVARADESAGTARVTSFDYVSGDRWSMTVYSPSMDREIPLDVLRPKSAEPAPTLYLLNGAGGGEDGATWLAQTDVEAFFAPQHVNVVVPSAGIGSYYTDWISPDPAVGQPKWRTFLSEELPSVIDVTLGTTGLNAIAGISMSATSVLDLAATTESYAGVASLSGCARTSTLEGQAAVRGIVQLASGGDATNMWGPWNGPEWMARDPYLRAEALRGKAIYLSSGSGLPGPYDTPEAPRRPGSPPLYEQILVGGAIEAAARSCTDSMAERLADLGIPATIHRPPVGTHSWLYWQDELHSAWPVLRDALDLDGAVR